LLAVSGTIWASGWAPFAREDNASVSQGGVVSVLDDGSFSVLDNDFDIEGDHLTAFLTKNPKHGDVILESDGTFRYQNDGKSDKRDEFKYRAFDGTGFSRETRVSINILKGDPIPPEIIGQKTVEVDEDTSKELKPGDLEVLDPDSNFPKDFSIEVNDGANYSASGSVITPVTDFNGELTVPVRVFDGRNYSNLFPLVVTVRPRNDAPFVIDVPADQEAIERTAYALSLAGYFDDIDEGDVLRFSAGGLPRSNSLVIDPVSGVLSGTPQRGDSRDTPYNVSITATDTGGGSASLNFPLIIYPDDRADLTLSAAVVLNPVMVGESANWQVDVLNQGPADLEEGIVVVNWSTSGPSLTISAPQSCTVQNNASSAPSATCDIAGMVAGSRALLAFQGTQNEDGDNTLIAIAVADDPRPGDNFALAGSQVIENFSEGPTQILGSLGVSMDVGDFDSDGNIDMLVAANETLVFYNSGNRDFLVPGQTVAPGGSVVAILDWNGDGALDIAVGGLSQRAAEIFTNDGNGGFESKAQLANVVVGTVRAMAAVDLDLDGSDELVVTGSNDTVILQRSGSADFDLIYPPVGAGIDIAIGDFNNDSFPDIAVVEASDRAVAVMINNGSGTSFSRTRQRHGSVGHVSTADLNGDGLDDLLLAIDGADLAPPGNKVLYRQSGGGFSVGNTFGASSVSKLLGGDVDDDGFMDIVAINEAGVHQLYRGDTNGNFTLHNEQIVSSGMQSGVLVDFNSDQSSDLIMAGVDAVEIHANNGIGLLGLGDRRPPVITLLGEAVLTIAAGTLYEDAGATANDDIDGDLNAEIVTSGTVNSTVVGTYNISYSVSDRAGNTSTTNRKVTVKVNDGVGGGGGGRFGPLMIFCLLLLLIFARGRNRISARLTISS
jgi:hypothetical protein